MLLFLALWALVPCLVLVTLYFLSSVGGKSGGNKKNDGVKVSPLGARQGRPPAASGPAGLAFRAGADVAPPAAAGPRPGDRASVPTFSPGLVEAGEAGGGEVENG